MIASMKASRMDGIRVVVTHSGSGSLLATDFARQILNVAKDLIGGTSDEVNRQ